MTLLAVVHVLVLELPQERTLTSIILELVVVLYCKIIVGEP